MSWLPSPTPGVGYRLYKWQNGTQSHLATPTEPPTLVYQGTDTFCDAPGLIPRVDYSFDVCTYTIDGIESHHVPCIGFSPDPFSILCPEIISPNLDTDTQLTGTITIRAQVRGGAGGIALVKLCDPSGATIDTLTTPTVEPDLYDLVWDLAAHPPHGAVCIFAQDVGTTGFPSASVSSTRCARALGYIQ